MSLDGLVDSVIGVPKFETYELALPEQPDLLRLNAPIKRAVNKAIRLGVQTRQAETISDCGTGMDCICRPCVGWLPYRSRTDFLSWPGNDCTHKGCYDCSWPNRSRQGNAGWCLVYFFCCGATPSRIPSLDGDGRIKLCDRTICSTGKQFRKHAHRASAGTTSGTSPWEIKALPSSKASGELKRRSFIATPTRQSLMERPVPPVWSSSPRQSKSAVHRLIRPMWQYLPIKAIGLAGDWCHALHYY